jgi:hypothetical protein
MKDNPHSRLVGKPASTAFHPLANFSGVSLAVGSPIESAVREPCLEASCL